MKTIESKIAPNPKEAQYWVDLTADPRGSITKVFNGTKWVLKDDVIVPTYSRKESDTLLSKKVDKIEGFGLSQNNFTDEEKEKLAKLKNYNDADLRKIIQILLRRIEVLESKMVIE